MNIFPIITPFYQPGPFFPPSRVERAVENAYMSCVNAADWESCPYKDEWNDIAVKFIAAGLDPSKFDMVAFPDKPTNDRFFLVLRLSLKSPNLDMP